VTADKTICPASRTRLCWLGRDEYVSRRLRTIQRMFVSRLNAALSDAGRPTHHVRDARCLAVATICGGSAPLRVGQGHGETALRAIHIRSRRASGDACRGLEPGVTSAIRCAMLRGLDSPSAYSRRGMSTTPHGRSNDLWVVGLSGRTGSGKTSAASLLAEIGYTTLLTRDVLSWILEGRGEEVTRAALQRLGAEVNSGHGQRWLLDQVARRVGESGRYTVDGLRFPEDHASLVERCGDRFLHVHLEAPGELRRRRFIARGGSDDEFSAAEIHVTESMAPTMRRLAHRIVINDGGRQEFGAAILEATGERSTGARTCR
jgi:dephospho-CoA kinase